MKPEERPEDSVREETMPQGESPAPEKEPYKPYSTKTRIMAWIGVVFMVFLVLMYAYVFASGKILTM